MKSCVQIFFCSDVISLPFFIKRNLAVLPFAWKTLPLWSFSINSKWCSVQNTLTRDKNKWICLFEIFLVRNSNNLANSFLCVCCCSSRLFCSSGCVPLLSFPALTSATIYCQALSHVWSNLCRWSRIQWHVWSSSSRTQHMSPHCLYPSTDTSDSKRSLAYKTATKTAPAYLSSLIEEYTLSCSLKDTCITITTGA